MGGYNPKMAGPTMIVVGLLLTVGSSWSALARSQWPEILPSILIGMSLTAVGYSVVTRTRRSHPTPEDDRP